MWPDQQPTFSKSAPDVTVAACLSLSDAIVMHWPPLTGCLVYCWSLLLIKPPPHLSAPTLSFLPANQFFIHHAAISPLRVKDWVFLLFLRVCSLGQSSASTCIHLHNFVSLPVIPNRRWLTRLSAETASTLGWQRDTFPFKISVWYFYHTAPFRSAIHFSLCWGDCRHHSWGSTEFSLSLSTLCVYIFWDHRCI